MGTRKVEWRRRRRRRRRRKERSVVEGWWVKAVRKVVVPSPKSQCPWDSKVLVVTLFYG